MKKKMLTGMLVLGVLLLGACGLPEKKTVSDTPEKVTVKEEKEKRTEETTAKTEAATETEGAETETESETESAPEDNRNEIAESLVAKVLEEADPGEDANICFVADDLDGDGNAEAFVFVGDLVDDYLGSCEGSLYFVNGEKCETLFEDFPASLNDKEDVFNTYDMGNRIFVEIREAYATATVSHLYYVEDGAVKESDVSRIGCFFEPAYVEDYAISISAYDNICEYEEGKESEAIHIGHTWKNYYYYYDPEVRDFRAYVGKEISEQELAEICGFDLAGEIRAEGYEVGTAFAWGNGVYTVNYSRTTKDSGRVEIQYKNASYVKKILSGEFIDVWGAGTGTWQDSDFGGTYDTVLGQ